MRVTAIPIVVGILGIVPKDFEKKLEELKIRTETVQITALIG